MSPLSPLHEWAPRGSQARTTPLVSTLTRDPTDSRALRSLYDNYNYAGQVDRACSVVEMLTVLGKNTPGQHVYLGRHRPAEPLAARAPLTEALLRDHVAHPDEDPYLTAIMSLVAPALAAWRAPIQPPCLDERDRIDPATHPSDAARMVKYAARVLNVMTPDLFLHPKERGDFSLLNVTRAGRLHPALVLYDRLLARANEAELAFGVSRAMAKLLVPHYAVVALDHSPGAVRQVLRALLRADGHVVHHGDADAHREIAAAIHIRMQPAARECLRQVVRQVAERGHELDAETWANAVEYTEARVALLLSGDIRIAAKGLAAEPTPLSAACDVTAKDRLHDLFRYALSDDYFIVRKALGIDISE